MGRVRDRKDRALYRALRWCMAEEREGLLHGKRVPVAVSESMHYPAAVHRIARWKVQHACGRSCVQLLCDNC